jgi:hypothetical protein
MDQILSIRGVGALSEARCGGLVSRVTPAARKTALLVGSAVSTAASAWFVAAINAVPNRVKCILVDKSELKRHG